MPIQTSDTRRPLDGRADSGEAQPDNRLSFMDQAFFATVRATGRESIVQGLWVYDRAVDMAGLRRFNHNLGYGLLGRRIERSPLPFARYRWVSCPTPPEIDVAASPRPRAELSDWVDERSQLPVDPEHGPGWHLGVLSLTDGSTAVSLVTSHCLLDGIGVGGAIADAVSGIRREVRYPPPRSRTRLRAVVSDAQLTARVVPDVGRALVAAAKAARRQRREVTPSDTSQTTVVSAGDSETRVIVPMVTIRVNLDDWDARAKALGGMSHHLVAGFAAKFGECLGRRRPSDGLVALQLPISDRIEGDDRANALSFVSIAVDPTQVTRDLRDVRVANGKAFRALRQAPDEYGQISEQTPVVPFVPKRVLKGLVDAAFAYDDLPVGCSNGGDVDPALGRPDGTDAAYASVRGGEQRVTLGHLERTRGQLTLWVARFGGNMCITVGAYQPAVMTSKPALRDLAAQTLAGFELVGAID